MQKLGPELTLTRIRQDEGIRFIKWTAECPEEWDNVLVVLTEGGNPRRVIQVLNTIKKWEFYFLLPFILDNREIDSTTDAAIRKLQLESFVRSASLNTFEGVCENIIKAIEKAMTTDRSTPL